MKALFISKLPTSAQGQFLIETPMVNGHIQRSVACSEGELHALASRDSTVWTARHGGWIKCTNPRAR